MIYGIPVGERSVIGPLWPISYPGVDPPPCVCGEGDAIECCIPDRNAWPNSSGCIVQDPGATPNAVSIDNLEITVDVDFLETVSGNPRYAERFDLSGTWNSVQLSPLGCGAQQYEGSVPADTQTSSMYFRSFLGIETTDTDFGVFLFDAPILSSRYQAGLTFRDTTGVGLPDPSSFPIGPTETVLWLAFGSGIPSPGGGLSPWRGNVGIRIDPSGSWAKSPISRYAYRTPNAPPTTGVNLEYVPSDGFDLTVTADCAGSGSVSFSASWDYTGTGDVTPTTHGGLPRSGTSALVTNSPIPPGFAWSYSEVVTIAGTITGLAACPAAATCENCGDGLEGGATI